MGGVLNLWVWTRAWIWASLLRVTLASGGSLPMGVPCSWIYQPRELPPSHPPSCFSQWPNGWHCHFVTFFRAAVGRKWGAGPSLSPFPHKGSLIWWVWSSPGPSEPYWWSLLQAGLHATLSSSLLAVVELQTPPPGYSGPFMIWLLSSFFPTSDPCPPSLHTQGSVSPSLISV